MRAFWKDVAWHTMWTTLTLIVGATVWNIAQPAQAAPKSPVAWEIPGAAGSQVRVYVIDTGSTCLYVARNADFDHHSGVALTSQPKSQLPIGYGC